MSLATKKIQTLKVEVAKKNLNAAVAKAVHSAKEEVVLAESAARDEMSKTKAEMVKKVLGVKKQLENKIIETKAQAQEQVDAIKGETKAKIDGLKKTAKNAAAKAGLNIDHDKQGQRWTITAGLGGELAETAFQGQLYAQYDEKLKKALIEVTSSGEIVVGNNQIRIKIIKLLVGFPDPEVTLLGTSMLGGIKFEVAALFDKEHRLREVELRAASNLAKLVGPVGGLMGFPRVPLGSLGLDVESIHHWNVIVKPQYAKKEDNGDDETPKPPPKLKVSLLKDGAKFSIIGKAVQLLKSKVEKLMKAATTSLEMSDMSFEFKGTTEFLLKIKADILLLNQKVVLAVVATYNRLTKAVHISASSESKLQDVLGIKNLEVGITDMTFVKTKAHGVVARTVFKGKIGVREVTLQTETAKDRMVDLNLQIRRLSTKEFILSIAPILGLSRNIPLPKDGPPHDFLISVVKKEVQATDEELAKIKNPLKRLRVQYSFSIKQDDKAFQVIPEGVRLLKQEAVALCSEMLGVCGIEKMGFGPNKASTCAHLNELHRKDDPPPTPPPTPVQQMQQGYGDEDVDENEDDIEVDDDDGDGDVRLGEVQNTRRSQYWNQLRARTLAAVPQQLLDYPGITVVDQVGRIVHTPLTIDGTACMNCQDISNKFGTSHGGLGKAATWDRADGHAQRCWMRQSCKTVPVLEYGHCPSCSKMSMRFRISNRNGRAFWSGMEPFAIQQCWVKHCAKFDSNLELLGEGEEPEENVNEQVENVKTDLKEKVKEAERTMKHENQTASEQQKNKAEGQKAIADATAKAAQDKAKQTLKSQSAAIKVSADKSKLKGPLMKKYQITGTFSAVLKEKPMFIQGFFLQNTKKQFRFTGVTNVSLTNPLGLKDVKFGFKGIDYIAPRSVFNGQMHVGANNTVSFNTEAEYEKGTFEKVRMFNTLTINEIGTAMSTLLGFKVKHYWLLAYLLYVIRCAHILAAY